jgi:hypothetical protein
LLLEGGLDWKGLSLSPKDMDFVEAKHIAAREIALSFGVPPMLLGIPGDNTYSNYAEANRAFYRQTVVPLISRIASALGNWLGESFGESLRLAPDLDEVPALSIEREALWKRVGDASFLTDDEKRAAAGYEPLPAQSLTTLLAKYSPDQPRVPAGNPDGGQWTSGSGYGSSENRDEESDQDSLPENAQPASFLRRTPTRININGRWQEITPAQGARLAEAEIRANDAIARVRERDPNWRPPDGIYSTVEGYITHLRGQTLAAESRLTELRQYGIGPGPFAGDSIPARGPGYNFNYAEREQGNLIGRTTGCHTCGTTEPGTPSGNFFLDHQLPNVWNPLGRPQRLYPQCKSCSGRQGGWLRWHR